MKLSDIVNAVAVKQLTQVDLPGGSHQHELNGTASLRQFFGISENVNDYQIEWHFLPDDGPAERETDYLTFYDARARSADRTNRTEWRCYYRGDFLNLAESGDVLVFIRRDGEVDGFIFKDNSAYLRAAATLFGFDYKELGKNFYAIPETQLVATKIEPHQELILSELGIDIVGIATSGHDQELVLDSFGYEYPTTNQMSELARQRCEVDISDPDKALMSWLSREWDLYRALEAAIELPRIQRGFTTVDEFIRYSKSVENRRKSRMGYSLMNQLAALFDAYDLTYERERYTEGANRPDFLFPSIAKYSNVEFDSQFLSMLAAKSSCKDRWRQILTEADRIPAKHLCTLEPSISESQTNEMVKQAVILVLPEMLLESYTTDQISRVLTVQKFISLVQEKFESSQAQGI